ncbi:hypothetical protein BST61_g11478 [Cercospora zeina]
MRALSRDPNINSARIALEMCKLNNASAAMATASFHGGEFPKPAERQQPLIKRQPFCTRTIHPSSSHISAPARTRSHAASSQHHVTGGAYVLGATPHHLEARHGIPENANYQWEPEYLDLRAPCKHSMCVRCNKTIAVLGDCDLPGHKACTWCRDNHKSSCEPRPANRPRKDCLLVFSLQHVREHDDRQIAELVLNRARRRWSGGCFLPSTDLHSAVVISSTMDLTEEAGTADCTGNMKSQGGGSVKLPFLTPNRFLEINRAPRDCPLIPFMNALTGPDMLLPISRMELDWHTSATCMDIRWIRDVMGNKLAYPGARLGVDINLALGEGGNGDRGPQQSFIALASVLGDRDDGVNQTGCSAFNKVEYGSSEGEGEPIESRGLGAHLAAVNCSPHEGGSGILRLQQLVLGVVGEYDIVGHLFGVFVISTAKKRMIARWTSSVSFDDEAKEEENDEEEDEDAEEYAEGFVDEGNERDANTQGPNGSWGRILTLRADLLVDQDQNHAAHQT